MMKRETKEEESKRDSVRVNNRKALAIEYFDKRYIDDAFVRNYGGLKPYISVRNVDGNKEIHWLSNQSGIVREGFTAKDLLETHQVGLFKFYISNKSTTCITIKSKNTVGTW
jgi:hypothetical protein